MWVGCLARGFWLLNKASMVEVNLMHHLLPTCKIWGQFIKWEKFKYFWDLWSCFLLYQTGWIYPADKPQYCLVGAACPASKHITVWFKWLLQLGHRESMSLYKYKYTGNTWYIKILRKKSIYVVYIDNSVFWSVLGRKCVLKYRTIHWGCTNVYSELYNNFWFQTWFQQHSLQLRASTSKHQEYLQLWSKYCNIYIDNQCCNAASPKLL